VTAEARLNELVERVPADIRAGGRALIRLIVADTTVQWGDDAGVTWKNADDQTKKEFALTRLFWFYRMEVFEGDPTLTDPLDIEVFQQAKEAAEWFGPILKEHAERAGLDES
jgi:hypothetical protein